MDERLDVTVTRNLEDLAQELVPDKSEKVDQGIEMPTRYNASVNSAGQDVEKVFLDAYADSKIGITVHYNDDEGFSPTEQDMLNMVKLSEGSDYPLRAQPEEICTHTPILQQGVDKLRRKGLDARLVITGSNTADTIRETTKGLEKKGLAVSVCTDQVNCLYDPENHTFKSAQYNTLDYAEKADKINQILSNL